MPLRLVVDAVAELVDRAGGRRGGGGAAGLHEVGLQLPGELFQFGRAGALEALPQQTLGPERSGETSHGDGGREREFVVAAEVVAEGDAHGEFP